MASGSSFLASVLDAREQHRENSEDNVESDASAALSSRGEEFVPDRQAFLYPSLE